MDGVVKIGHANIFAIAGGKSDFYYPGTQDKMFHYVYIIESVKNKNLYVGQTIDLNNRLKEHNQGLNVSTKSYKPWKLVHYEAYLNEKDAKRREGYLKTSQGTRIFKRMLKEYFYKKSNV